MTPRLLYLLITTPLQSLIDILAISPFAIQNPYLPLYDDLVQSQIEQSDFEIVSDVSDNDLLELKQNVMAILPR